MQDCIFCKIVRGELPSAHVYEDENVFAFFDVNPVSEYHTLVIPKKHFKDIFNIPTDELQHVAGAIKRIADLFKTKVGIENLQIVSSSGSEAQQDVFHIHFHIVPRKEGDGQNIQWTPKTEIRERFEELLKRLQPKSSSN